MNLVFAVLYGIIMIMFRKQLIGFFNIKGDDIVSMAKTYLAIVSSGYDILLFTTCTYSNI